MVSNKRAYLEMSFTWIFAFLVGAFILFLAIFALTKFINTEKTSQDLTSAKDISVLLNPLETSFEQGKITSLKAPTNSRIYSGCDLEGTFGHQQIKFNQEIYNKWTETNDSIDSQSKYLFSENPEEGKLFYLFSKPFNFPFKVGSLIYLNSADKKYCFKGSGTEFNEIKREMENLGHPSIFLGGDTEDCTGDEINVCFGIQFTSGCDISVNFNQNFVQKGNEIFYFATPKLNVNTYDYSLMYAAIFSDKGLYECQSQRLINRTLALVQIYKTKLLLPSLDGCNSALLGDLNSFENQLENFEDSRNFPSLVEESNDIFDKNKYNPGCRIW